ncbi:MAG: membrane metalloprotease [Vicingaceae bacterium]
MKLAKPILSIFLIFLLNQCKKDDSNSSSKQSAGKLANAYLSDKSFKSLEIEILYESGTPPEVGTLDSIKSFLSKRLNKSEGINIYFKKIPDQQQSTYQLEEIESIEQTYRSLRNRPSIITASYFYANGNYSGDSDQSKTLGIAYGSTSMVIFAKTIRDMSGDLGQASTDIVEQSVMKHEFGHLLGLVNVGTPMVNNHQDTAHGKHCDNDNCLMHWSIESGDFISNLIGSSPPQLDVNCMADLRANGGK